jgi:hypothetical protein
VQRPAALQLLWQHHQHHQLLLLLLLLPLLLLHQALRPSPGQQRCPSLLRSQLQLLLLLHLKQGRLTAVQ